MKVIKNYLLDAILECYFKAILCIYVRVKCGSLALQSSSLADIHKRHICLLPHGTANNRHHQQKPFCNLRHDHQKKNESNKHTHMLNRKKSNSKTKNIIASVTVCSSAAHSSTWTRGTFNVSLFHAASIHSLTLFGWIVNGEHANKRKCQTFNYIPHFRQSRWMCFFLLLPLFFFFILFIVTVIFVMLFRL